MNKSKNKSKDDDSGFEDMPDENDYSSKLDISSNIAESILPNKFIEKTASIACNGKQLVVRIPTEI